MDHSQRGTNSDASSATAESSSLMPNVLFREIHKNAFLKRHSSDRRTGFPRKSERVWVVFCVHDDVEPFLEIYPDQKVALTHKPEWFASLTNVLHVSPTICGHEDEFEFAVTLSFQVVRLSAPSWDSMMEWVETIRNKLRELKVLCPKENIYSKMPEQKQPLLPTRDPNSPLPLPPEGPSTLLPGVELVHLETRNNQLSSDNSENLRPQRNVHSRSNIQERRAVKKRINVAERSVHEAGESSANAAGENNQEVTVSETAPTSSGQSNKIRPARTNFVPQPRPSTSDIPSGSNITVIEVSTSGIENNFLPKCNPSSKFDVDSDNEDIDEDVFLISSVSQKVVEKNSCGVNTSEEETHYEHVFLPSVPIVKPQMLQSTQNKSTVSCILVDGNKSKKTHSTSLLISPSNSNSSQNENVASTSSVSMLTSSNNEVLNNLPSSSVAVKRNSDGDVPEANDVNGPLSSQIQSKLEKVNISGLIPRVPAKSSKLGVLKPPSNFLRDSNVIASDGKRNSEIGYHSSQLVSPVSEDQGASKVSSCDSSRTNAVGISPPPAYSQVKKIHKVKNKSEEVRTEEHSGQKASPVLSRRKMPEIQVLEVEPQVNKKPECLPVSSAGKSQACLADSKASNNNNQPSKAAGSRKQESGSDVSRNQVSNSEYRSAETSGSCPSTSGSRVDNGARINLTKKESFGYCNNNPEIEPITATVQPAVGVISVEDIPLIGGHQRRRRRSSSSDATPASNAPSSRGIGGADRIRINVPLTANHPPRDVPRSEAETRSSHARTAEHNPQTNAAPPSSRLTLREQQVMQLKKEMLHPGGVRLQLRRKDCTGSIALVDVLNGVWVAGWKQKEHPLLYNALHIGDQLISVGEVLVRSSAEAQKLIRSSTSLYIEFIIRRVPFGNVFALQRSSEGQSLGIVQEGNTAEIKDVVANGVAARQGLTSKTPSCDGLSLTTWFLTEINGRPLNLFFKDNEVRDRLNAVGKEISILVQPNDFIKQIKKQLKNIRSYKDYIVQ